MEERDNGGVWQAQFGQCELKILGRSTRAEKGVELAS